jgi:prepilin-type N-terminal cleavage/methylation domain-containing protein
MNLEKRVALDTGFTLVELLVVIAVVGILGGLIFGGINQMREKARNAVAVQNMKGVYAAIVNYTADHNGKLPPIRHQNDDFNRDWREEMARLGYFPDVNADNWKKSKSLGNPNLWSLSPQGHRATIGLNIRIGYRSNPRPWHGPRILFQAPHPGKTLLLGDAAYRAGGDTWCDFYDALQAGGRFCPQASYNDVANICFMNGTVLQMKMDEIPDSETGDGMIFWRGHTGDMRF